MPEESTEASQDQYGVSSFLEELRKQDPSPEHSLKVDDYDTRHRELTDQLNAHQITSEEYERLENGMYLKDAEGRILLDNRYLNQEILNQVGRLTNKASIFSKYRAAPAEVIDRMIADGFRILLDKFPQGKNDLEQVVRSSVEKADELERLKGVKIDSWASLRPALSIFEENDQADATPLE